MAIESVVGILFNPDRDQVLLIQRRDVPVWVLPGGGVEANEDPKEAICREIFEETGLRVTIRKQIGLYYPINRLAKVTALYECFPISGKLLASSSETRAAAFFSLKNLPHKLPPPTKRWIEDALPIEGQFIETSLTEVNYKAFCIYLLRYPHLVMRFLLARLGLPWNS